MRPRSTAKTNPSCAWLAVAVAAALYLAGCGGALPDIAKTNVADSPTRVELENYVELAIELNEISIETFLLLLDKHFDNEIARNKELYAEYEEKKKRFYAGQLKDEPMPPRIDHSRLIISIESVMKHFSSRPGGDSLVYALGYAHYENGSYEESIKAFSRLVAEFPGSRLYEETNFRLGEMYFDEGRIVEAAEAYSRLTDDPDSVFYDKALYKLAWAHYRAGNYAMAFGTFNSILEHGYENAEDESTAAIAKEAFLNSIDALAHMDSADAVAVEIEKIKKATYASPITIGLGKLLMEQTRYAEAEKIFTIYEKTFPDDLNMPTVMLLSAKCAEARGNTAAAKAINEAAFTKFHPETDWFKKRGNSLNNEIKASIAELVLDIAKAHQKAGLETNDLSATKKSIEAYTIFLRAFPEHPSAKEANISLGEQLFNTGDYDAAAKWYSDIMTRWKKSDDGERAAFSALISYELTTTTGKEFNKPALASSIEKTLNFYSSEYASSKRRTEFIVRAIDIYMRIESFSKAREAASLLKDTEPFIFNAKTAESFVLEKNYTHAISSYETALETKNDAATREKLSAIYFISAETLEKQGKGDAAVEHYLRAFKLSKSSRHGEDSLLRAARIRLSSGDYEDFDSITSNFKNNFPSSQGAYLLLIEGAKAKEAAYDLSGAASYYSDAAAQASLAGKPADRDRLLIKTADLLKEDGNYEAISKLLRAQYGKGAFSSSKEILFEALFRLGEAELQLGDKKSALKTFSLASEKGNGDISEARIKSALTDLKLEEFTNYAIKEPVNTTLKKKEAMLKELLAEYSLIIKSQASEFLPKAFYGMGVAYENYGRSLMDSPRPKGLSDEELKEYNFLLEEKTYPLEEEAVKAYSSALKASSVGKSAEYGKWGALSVEKLAKLRPVLYKRTMEKFTGTPIFAEPMPIVIK